MSSKAREDEKARPIEKWSLGVGAMMAAAGIVIALELGHSADHLNEQSLTTANASLLAEQEEAKLCAGAHIIQFLTAEEHRAEQRANWFGSGLQWFEDTLLAPVFPAFNHKRKVEFDNNLTTLAYRIYSSAHKNVALPPSVKDFDPSKPVSCTEKSVGQVLSEAVVGRIPQLFIVYFSDPLEDPAQDPVKAAAEDLKAHQWSPAAEIDHAMTRLAGHFRGEQTLLYFQ